jgi:hypothetical protein
MRKRNFPSRECPVITAGAPANSLAVAMSNDIKPSMAVGEADFKLIKHAIQKGGNTMTEATIGRSYSCQCQEFVNGWKDRACGAGREALTDIFVKAFKEASTVHAGSLRAKNPAGSLQENSSLRDLISDSIDDGLPLLFIFSDHSVLEVKRGDAGLHISSGMHNEGALK